MCVFCVNIFVIVAVKSRIPDKRRCVDSNCSVRISTAVAQLNYRSDHPLVLSFPAGAQVEVYSYGAGMRDDLWGIKYRGKRGYGPKALLRENKKYVPSKDVNTIVPTEIDSEFSVLDSKVDVEQNIVASSNIGGKGFFGGIVGASAAESDIKPDKVKVVVEGTTLYNMESSPDDESVAGEFVTPGTVDGGLPLPILKQVPETTTTPSVEASKSEQHSEPEKKISDDATHDVENRTHSGSEARQSYDGVSSDENVSAAEEGDYADYEEGDEEEEEEEGKVEEEPDDTNITETTEDPRKEPIEELVSTADVKIDNVTENIVEKQQPNVQGAESEHPAEPSGTKEEPSSHVRNEIVIENFKSEQAELISEIVENEQNVNMSVDETKQSSGDVVSPQSPETVQQREVQLNSPLTAEQGVDSDLESSKVSSVDSIPEEPESVITQGGTDVSKEEEEKQIEDAKSDQIPANSISSSNSEIIQEDATKTEEKQKTEEPPYTERSSSSIPEGELTQEKQLEPAIGGDSNVVEDNVAGSIVSDAALPQQLGNEDHSDTAKTDADEDLPQTVSNESNETENIGGSESVASVPEVSVEGQSVEVGGDNLGVSTIVQKEEVEFTEDVIVSDKPETIYDSHDASIGDATYPEKVPESVSSEEPILSEDVNSETISKDYISSVMTWFSSSVKSFQGYFQSPTSHSDIPNTSGEEPSNTVSSVPESVENRERWDQSKPDSLKDTSCLIHGIGEEDSCEKVTKLPPPAVWAQSESTSTGYEVFGTVIDFDKLPFETILWLLVTAGTILTFTLGHYYIEAHRRDGLLVARINKLERELLVLRKESSLLEDQLSKAQDEIQAVDSSSSEAEALITALKLELEENKVIRMDLEEQVTSLEKELESVTESGLEMHRLLSESLSNQDGSQVLLKTVENLREKLNTQVAEISLLNQNIFEKNEEIESLQNDVANSQEMYKQIEEKLKALQRDKEEEALELKDKHRALSAQLEEAIESKALDEMRTSTEISKLKLNIDEIQRNYTEKEAELETMRDAVKQLQSADKKMDVDALYDVVSIGTKLKTTEKEKDEFKEKFLEEEGARKLLEDHVRVISREVASLKENFEAAEKEKIDALTKLQVLSNYFKEKESQLQKELGLQESMWLQKQSADHTIYEQMKSLREENEKYKLQNESLRKEICEQESSFKIQIANIEQRAHENWVAHRQSERRLKEVQQEASQLRNRLTLSEKNAANHTMDDAKPKISESNGDPSSPPPSLIFPATTSPPFMMYPGLPGEFIPPPPLVSAPFSPDSRPPPLGRISSPQLDPRFSPPPPLPYSPYDFPYGGHHSPSPPPPLPQHRTVHKPQPRENAREQKDSSSTNYNASETSDKPRRSRNKR